MLEDFIGEERFRKGVTAYLRKNSYGNTVTQDLLDELQVVVGDEMNVTLVLKFSHIVFPDKKLLSMFKKVYNGYMDETNGSTIGYCYTKRRHNYTDSREIFGKS
jgi:hypothetical protein